MNILILTYGSRGDVQPYIALGKGLQGVGHAVTLATSDRFQGFVESHGLDYAYMSDDLLSIVDTDEGKDLLEKGSNLYEMIKRGLKIQKQVKPAQRALLHQSWDAAQDTKPDFIIFHPKAGAAPHVAEKLGIGCALVTPIPMMVPTKDFRFPIFPDLPLGDWYNRSTYHAIQFMINNVWKGYIKDFREALDMPPVKNFKFIKNSDGSDIPILHAHSEAVVPRPEDWPETAQVSGYLFLDEEQEWTPPQDLVDFLEAGPPPVYVGFGSMAGRDPERFAKIVVDALQEANLRGVIATGWGGLQADDLPETIFKIDQAPHDWLFPKMSAVVHHGGAGTTAAGLRAGKPTIIVPFFADQPFWGNRVHEMGAGPKPLMQKKLTAGKLADAMREATSNQAMIDTAAEIGCKIRAEDGIARAVDLIEEYALKL
ncbi:MAG: glycosyltransferase family 1 protein [Alphaproteobacteria bacterium]|nr:glycosyltransferase family 1 protein [Alphaproteobacteria bacterium]